MNSVLSPNLIHISVALASVLVVGLGAVLVWQAFAAHQALNRVQLVHQATDHLLQVKASSARVRGWGAAALGGGYTTETRAQFEKHAGQGDEHLRQALALVRQLEKDFANSALIRTIRGRLEAQWGQHQELRERLRQELASGEAGINYTAWFSETTAFIDTAIELRQQLLLSVGAPQEAMLDAHGILNRLARIGEYAGQNRAILAYYTAAGEPVSDRSLERVHTNGTAIQQAMGEVLVLAETQANWEPELERVVETAMTRIAAFHTVDVPYMIDTVGREDNPLDGVWWLEAATEAIHHTVLASDRTLEHMEGTIRQEAQRGWLTLILYGLLALAAGALAVFSLVRVHRDAISLHVQKELAETTLSSIGDAVITADAAGRVTYLNPVAEELTGWLSVDAQGRPAPEVLRLRHTRHASMRDPIGACLQHGCTIGLSSGHVLTRPDGREVAIEDSCAPIRDPDGAIAGAVLVFYDTENVHQQHHLLAYHATRDTLTGLINRREFERRLDELVNRPNDAKGQHALAYMDLDQFKVVNDTAGHIAGDQLLRQLSFLLRRQVRESDVLARLGGDEFALILYNCPLENAATVCAGLLQVFQSFRFSWGEREFDVGASIGLVPITDETSSALEALSDADNACFIAKNQGRNQVHVHSQDDEEVTRRRQEMEWATRIREMLRAEQFTLHAQPMAPLAPGLPSRQEVLVRIMDTDGQAIMPMAFIPAAERFGYMREIDRWVIRNACALLAEAHHYDSETVFNVNLSGASLSDRNLAGFILAETAQHGVSPDQVCFEITETAVINNLDTAVDLMQELKEHGFTFALDDFGVGSSSFSYLRNLPVNMLKIDGTFIQTMTQDPINRAIVQSIVTISRIMGLTVSAEFVEDQETLEQLRQMGIHYAQGFSVGYPGPLTNTAIEAAPNMSML